MRFGAHLVETPTLEHVPTTTSCRGEGKKRKNVFFTLCLGNQLCQNAQGQRCLCASAQLKAGSSLGRFGSAFWSWLCNRRGSSRLPGFEQDYFVDERLVLSFQDFNFPLPFIQHQQFFLTFVVLLFQLLIDDSQFVLF